MTPCLNSTRRLLVAEATKKKAEDMMEKKNMTSICREKKGDQTVKVNERVNKYDICRYICICIYICMNDQWNEREREREREREKFM